MRLDRTQAEQLPGKGSRDKGSTLQLLRTAASPSLCHNLENDKSAAFPSSPRERQTICSPKIPSPPRDSVSSCCGLVGLVAGPALALDDLTNQIRAVDRVAFADLEFRDLAVVGGGNGHLLVAFILCQHCPKHTSHHARRDSRTGGKGGGGEKKDRGRKSNSPSS